MTSEWELWDEDGWETVENVKKINRVVRKERKIAEAAASNMTVGEIAPEFNTEQRRRLASATFYGKKEGRHKSSKSRAPPSATVGPDGQLDFGEAGWTGSHDQSLLLDGKKKKKSKEKNIPTFNTADDIVDTMVGILQREKVATKKASLTIAALGDKLQTLSHQQWNKAFKPVYGTMKNFMSKYKHFTINDDWVTLNESQLQFTPRQSTPSSTKSPARSSQASSSRSSSTNNNDDDDDDDDVSSDDEEDDDQDGQRVASPKKNNKTKNNRAKSSSLIKVLSILFIFGAALIYLILSVQKPSHTAE